MGSSSKVVALGIFFAVLTPLFGSYCQLVHAADQSEDGLPTGNAQALKVNQSSQLITSKEILRASRLYDFLRIKHERENSAQSKSALLLEDQLTSLGVNGGVANGSAAGGGGSFLNSCSLDRSDSAFAHFTPILVCEATDTYPTAYSLVLRRMAGNFLHFPESGGSYWKAFTVTANADGSLTNFAALPTGEYEQVLAFGMSDTGILTGVGCRPGKCGDCIDQYGEPQNPSATCDFEALTWSSPSSTPQALPELATSGYFNNFEARDISADGNRIVGTKLKVLESNPTLLPSTDMMYWSKNGTTYEAKSINYNAGGTGGVVFPECTSFTKCVDFSGIAVSQSGQYAAIQYHYKDTVNVDDNIDNEYFRTVRSTRIDLDDLAASPYTASINAPYLDAAETLKDPASTDVDNTFPSWAVQGLSPDGGTLVGAGLNDALNLPLTLFPSPLYTFYYNDSLAYPFQLKAVSWRYQAGLSIDQGVFPELVGGTTFVEYVARDASSIAGRIVGEGYRGGEEDQNDNIIEETDKYRTAFVSPSFSGVGGIYALKDELKINKALDIDQHNSDNVTYQLIGADRISEDQQSIIGTAICHGKEDFLTYGYVVNSNLAIPAPPPVKAFTQGNKVVRENVPLPIPTPTVPGFSPPPSPAPGACFEVQQ